MVPHPAPPTARYYRAADVEALAGAPPLLRTARGGTVAVDDDVMAVWRAAEGQGPAQIASRPEIARVGDLLPEVLTCLAAAGLLRRDPPWLRPEPVRRAVPAGRSVGALIVVSTPGERQWLDGCLASVVAQSHRPAAIALVDNGSGCHLASSLAGGPVTVLDRRSRANFATALNESIPSLRTDDYLLLNPDVVLHRHASANLCAVAAATPRCAAVAPKLHFWRTPGFLNGIGNRVQARNWGTDNGVGQLDLGQFECIREVPCASLSTMLMTREAWEAVGRFDPAYPAYYDDADWGYRARALGFCIAAAPDAEAEHVFGAAWTADGVTEMSHAQTATAIAGRLRFSLKVPSPASRWRLSSRHVYDDFRMAGRALREGDWGLARACASGYRTVAAGWRSLLRERRALHARRVLEDGALLDDMQMPASSLWGQQPSLTLAVIRDVYAPWLRSVARQTVGTPGVAEHVSRSSRDAHRRAMETIDAIDRQ